MTASVTAAEVAEIEELERLLKAATPGPWKLESPDDTMVCAADREVAEAQGDYDDYDDFAVMEANAALITKMRNVLPALLAEIKVGRADRAAADERVKAAESAKGGAYAERNQLVALLAKLFPSGIRPTYIQGWDPDWHGCVYIDLPTGQASWHYHDSEAGLFADLPPYTKDWDGHSTEEKYRRIAALRADPAAAPREPAEQPVREHEVCRGLLDRGYSNRKADAIARDVFQIMEQIRARHAETSRRLARTLGIAPPPAAGSSEG